MSNISAKMPSMAGYRKVVKLRDRKSRRRGPRFTDESTQETEDRIRDAAVRVVQKHGVEALSFSMVADDLKVTRTAPLYYFGSRLGLLAAIAEYGFREVLAKLQQQREAGGGSDRPAKHLALSYAEYALENPELYRAMHASDLLC